MILKGLAAAAAAAAAAADWAEASKDTSGFLLTLIIYEDQSLVR